VPVVTPNKVAVSSDLSTYHRIRGAARKAGVPFRYETTVGAALPVVRAVRELRESGDQIRRIEGVLSGTLSFVFDKLGQGVPFSKAVREARERGFTEPHPGEDLSGADVGRKLLILCREAGFDLEAGSIQIESLVPEALAREEDPEAFLTGLESCDEEWKARMAEAGGGRLAYVAQFHGEGGTVGVKTLPAGDPMAALRATENMVVVETDRYAELPLTISGPGAGWEVTASGVLADLLAAIRERYPKKVFPGAGVDKAPGGSRRVA
jgi:aspartokinase/homoserine dehydrogenase 1